jgi:hypothetical protein
VGQPSRKVHQRLSPRNEVFSLYLCLCLSTNKLHGLSPRANYTDRATAAFRRSDCQLLRIDSATWPAWRIPTAVFRFSRQEPLLFYQVAPQLYSHYPLLTYFPRKLACVVTLLTCSREVLGSSAGWDNSYANWALLSCVSVPSGVVWYLCCARFLQQSSEWILWLYHSWTLYEPSY